MEIEFEEIKGSYQTLSPDNTLSVKNKLNGNFDKIQTAFTSMVQSYEKGFLCDGFIFSITNNKCTLSSNSFANSGALYTLSSIYNMGENYLNYTFDLTTSKTAIFPIFVNKTTLQWIVLSIIGSLPVELPPINESIYMGMVHLSYDGQITYSLNGSSLYYYWKCSYPDPNVRIGDISMFLPQTNLYKACSLNAGTKWGLYPDGISTETSIYLFQYVPLPTLSNPTAMELYVKRLHQTNPAKLTLQYNGTTVGTYDGSSDKTINIVVPPAINKREPHILKDEIYNQQIIIKSLIKRIEQLEKQTT